MERTGLGSLLEMGFQLTLGLKLSAKNTLENFIGQENRSLINFLIEAIDDRKHAIAHINGQKKSGKSHLLQACCHRLVYQGLQAAYLDMKQIDSLNILNGMEQLRLVCFDNWTHGQFDEQQITLLKKFVEQSCRNNHIVLFGSHQDPDTQFFSSFKQIQYFTVAHPQSSEMPFALHEKMNERGLQLPVAVQKIILQKSGNSVRDLQDILDIIEKSQDSEKAKINISLLKRLLATA